MSIDNAIRTLKDEQDPVLRREAAQEIMAFGAYRKEVLEIFVKGLLDCDLGVKDICSRALIGTSGELSGLAAELTAPLLRTNDIEIRNLAGDILLGIGKPAVQTLKKYVMDDDYVVRQSVCSLLGRIGNETVIDDISKLLEDENQNVVISAVEALGNIGSESTLEKLIPLYNSSEELKPMVTDAIGKIGGRQAHDFLVGKLNTETDDFLKTACIDALASGADDGQICSELIKDLPNAPVNLQPVFLKTIFAIAQRKNINIELPAQLRPIARKALLDNDEDIRIAGLIALGTAYVEADIPGLVNQSLKDNPELHQLIIYNLLVNSETETVEKFFNNLFSFSDPDSIFIEFVSFLPVIWNEAKEDNANVLTKTIINIILESKTPSSDEVLEIMITLNRNIVVEYLSELIEKESRYLDELLEIIINFEITEIKEKLEELLKRNKKLSVKVREEFESKIN